MPMVTNPGLWIAAGVTAAMGGAAFVYWRKNRIDGNTQILKVDDPSKAAPTTVKTTNRGGRSTGVLKKIMRERKMVFVVNRPLLMNKQTLFVTVSTACLRYYRSVSTTNREYYDAHVKPWTRMGQMKVVLKANDGHELRSISERCRAEGVEALLLTKGDLKMGGDESNESTGVEKKGNKKTTAKKKDELDEADPSTPVIVCVLAPTEKLDRITGHLKLL